MGVGLLPLLGPPHPAQAAELPSRRSGDLSACPPPGTSCPVPAGGLPCRSSALGVGLGARPPGPLHLQAHGPPFLQLQIWDTAGQERFRTITQSYYRSANGAILAYDITKRSSFLSVPHWIEDVRKYAGSNIVQLLIGEAGCLSVYLLCK